MTIVDEVIHEITVKVIGGFIQTNRLMNNVYNDNEMPQNEGGDDNGDDLDGKCELIGTFSLMTQGLLGLLCLSSLFFKRLYEHPIRRTWSVWFFDVSKQLIGALGVHIFNVVLSIIETETDTIFIKNNDNDNDNDMNPGDGWDDGSQKDPCDWYFLNIVFDCTIGVYVFYLIFKFFNKVCRDVFHMTGIKSGDYGPDPTRPSLKAYMKQFSIYFTAVMITKVLLYLIINVFELQLLWITKHILLVWLNDYPDEFEIFVVMFIVPIIMNCLQLILVDNIIKNTYLRRTSGTSRTSITGSDTLTSESEINNDSNSDHNKSYGTFNTESEA